MSLGWYRRPRLVVLNADAPVLNAARAMDQNNIGAVLVLESGKVAGILTDRDLAVRATGQGLDPANTPISAIMSSPVITLPLQADQREALKLMQTRHIRRIPLLEGERLAGIVTLDDLVLDEGASPEEVSSVIEGQLGGGGPSPTPRSPAAMRSASRAASTYRQLIHRLQEETGLESFEGTETVVHLVLSSLLRRLTDGEGQDLLAQLPSVLRETFRTLPPGPDPAISRDSVIQDLVQRLDVDPDRAASLLGVVGRTLLGGISEGQAVQVRNQLPADLRAAVSSAP